jgi:hypothetical protein
MSEQRHTVSGWQTPTAERSVFGGGARRPRRAAPANRHGQAIPKRCLQPLRFASAVHSGGGRAFENIRASQPLRHARGALRRTRPTHLRPIQPNRGKSTLYPGWRFPERRSRGSLCPGYSGCHARPSLRPGTAALRVRARPRALRYDFLPCLRPIPPTATNGRLITSSKTSDAAATRARCCGRGRPRSGSAPVLGR